MFLNRKVTVATAGCGVSGIVGLPHLIADLVDAPAHLSRHRHSIKPSIFGPCGASALAIPLSERHDLLVWRQPP